MKPSENVKAFAELLGVDNKSVKCNDRLLAGAGLRRTTSGRGDFNVNRRENLLLLLSLMGGRFKSTPVFYALTFQKFKLHPEGVRIPSGSTEASPEMIGMTVEQLRNMDLIDVLLGIINHQCSGNLPMHDLSLKVYSENYITIDIYSDAFQCELFFTDEIAFAQGIITHQGEFIRYSEITNRALIWIGQNSEVAS